MPAKKKAAKKAAKKAVKKSPKQINAAIKRDSKGAVKSILDLPGRKRPGSRQIETARTAKALKVKPKVLKRKYGRFELSLGRHKLEYVAGVVKGFRQTYKEDFGTLFKDESGNVLARTHVARGKGSTIPEQLAVKAISKYAKGFDDVEIIISVKPPKKETKKATKKAAKKPAKKAAKKPAKKATKKPAKKATKKPAKKQAESYTVKGYTKAGKPIKKKAKVVYAAPKKKAKKK